MARLLTYPRLIIVLLWALVALPGLTSLAPMDRDEGRYVQATKQMLETGDYVSINYQDTPRHKKPIGIYWLQAASVKLLNPDARAEIWAYRIPSALGLLISMLAVHAIGARLLGALPALFGAGLFGVSLVAASEAHLAKTDSMLNAMTLLALWALARLRFPAERERVPAFAAMLIFWLAMGAGILIKGPMTPLIAGATLAALWILEKDRAWMRQLRPATGIPVMVLMTAPWFVAITQATGGAFWREAVGVDLAQKVVGGGEAFHVAPPLYHTVLLVLVFWPGSLFVPAGLISAWRERSSPAIRFLLAWIIPGWLIFELTPNKLPHYPLLVYGAIALLAARAALEMPKLTGWAAIGNRVWTGWWLVATAALIGLMAYLPARFGLGDPSGAAVPVVAAAAVLMLGLGRGIGRIGPMGRAGRMILAGGATFAGLLGLLAPTLPNLFPSVAIAHMITRADPARERPVAVAGYAEPSLVFLTGTETKLTTGDQAADFLASHPLALIVVEDRQWDAFAAEITASGIETERLDQVTGFNYSNGRAVELKLYRRKMESPAP